jgi:hypothetical protein
MTHDIKFTIPERPLGRADIKLDVETDGAKLGTLKISKGAIVWIPRDHSYGLKFTWEDFAKLATIHGARE